jgi:hypothetical protein
MAGLECEFVISVRLAADRGAELEVFVNPQSAEWAGSASASEQIELPEVPLVRALVDLHGGTLSMTSRGASGFYARVVLPAWRTLASSAE